MSSAETANGIPRSPKAGARRGARKTEPVGVALAVLIAATLAACGTSQAPMTPGPPAPRLPAISATDGPLNLRVSYPRDSLAIATRGRNFIFGSAGSGRARVWINGREVEVEPNGGFLAFLPVPDDSVYRLRATLAGESQTLEVPISLPPVPPTAGDSAVIVDASIHPIGARVALPGERIEVGFVGTAAGEAWLEFDDHMVPLVAVPPKPTGATDFEVRPRTDDAAGNPPRGSLDADAATRRDRLAVYRGFFAARRIVSSDTGVPWPRLADEPRPLPAHAEGAEAEAAAHLVLVVGPDTVRKPLPVNLLLADPARPRTGVGLDLDPPDRNGDGRIVGRPGPGGGPYHYFWANGVELELTGEWNGAYRVRLTDELSAWTPADDVQLRAPVLPPPASRVVVVRLDPQPGHVDVHIALDRRLPYRVEEGERSVAIVVYGAVSRANFLQHGRVDPYIQRAEWSQPSDREFRVDVALNDVVWGYETRWSGDDLVLRLNRPPTIDPARPLRGLTIGVDPGHGGTDTLTMGPTGLTEADANLGVALALRAELERRGARVVMSRLSNTTESLVQRTRLARAEDVDVWISVHNNALPDGVEPWENSGTSVYYNHPRAAGLAWSVQRSLLDELGLRDLGVGRADLHPVRFTWAPAILSESLFMMIPAHEAFLKTENGQRRVAEAHVRGLADWLRAIGTRQQTER
ncbi:MAG: N-acetylmuramoyl-L-alanine amidase [Longimicrobiales bacterium]